MLIKRWQLKLLLEREDESLFPLQFAKNTQLEGRLKIIETEEGILLQPKKSIWASFWDMIDAHSEPVTADK